MSTRCNIRVTQSGLGDWTNEIQLYRHCDGYPSSILPDLANIFESCGGGYEAGRAGKSAAFIIKYGDDCYEPENGLRLHGDIDYLYLVRCVNKNGGSLAEKATWEVEVRAPKDFKKWLNAKRPGMAQTEVVLPFTDVREAWKAYQERHPEEAVS